MSNIDKEKLTKEKQEIIDEKIQENKKIDLKQESLFYARGLLNKLLQNQLHNQLTKLETNSSNHMTSLKNSSKSLNDLTKLINDLIKNVEETKKKKIKDKPNNPIQRRERKTLTIKSRSRTIDSNLLKFRSKATLTTVDTNKKKVNNNVKILKKMNTNIRKLGNRTMTNFRTNDNESTGDNTSQKYMKFQNFANNTTQNFRKNNNKQILDTPKGKVKEKIKNKNLDKTFNQISRNTISDFYNKNNKKKKNEYTDEKNLQSRSLVFNPLPDIEERTERKTWNNMIRKNPKNLKGMLYKNDKKTLLAKLNGQLDTIDEKNNKTNYNKTQTQTKNKERESNEQVENIVKLVDIVNQNVNKLLTENQNKKKMPLKEGNNKINKIIEKTKSSKALLNAIKEVNISKKEDHKNENKKITEEKTENTNKELVDENKNEAKKIKDNNNIINTPLNIKEKNDNLLTNIDINKEEKEVEKIVNTAKNNFNRFEKIEIIKLRKNKSTSKSELVINNIEKNNSNIKYNRSYKEIKKIKVVNKIKEKPQIKKKTDADGKVGAINESGIIINYSQITNKIRNKMKEKIDKINKQNKILETKLLNESKKVVNNIEQKDKKEQINESKIIDNNNNNFIVNKKCKENIKNININNNLCLNRSLTILMKNRINNEAIIKRVKSVDKLRKDHLLI